MDAMERFVARCRAARLVVTPQLLTVFRHLAAGHGHPSAEELYATVRRELPTLSLATVYKTLDALARVGAVRVIPWHANLRSAVLHAAAPVVPPPPATGPLDPPVTPPSPPLIAK
jgi:Fur family peroxide stress response transcriptional regulator